MPFSVGVTGRPGAGKSTLTDRLIAASLERFVPDGAAAPVDQVGVLCVDPTSPFSGGAILGDRVRMQDHALDRRVFIRSLASRGHLGGLSVAVPDALRGARRGRRSASCSSRPSASARSSSRSPSTATRPSSWSPRAGATRMQAAKAGLLEIADVFVVNKADRPGAAEARRDLDQMLDLGTGRDDGWRPPIVETVATDGRGHRRAARRARRVPRTSTGARRDARRRDRTAVAASPARRRDGSHARVDELVAVGALRRRRSTRSRGGTSTPTRAVDALLAT